MAVNAWPERAPLIYVMGPSGAGKDTLIRFARETLARESLAPETLAPETLAPETLAQETSAQETSAQETSAQETSAQETSAGGAFAFAHRYITRAPVAGDENVISLSDAEFDLRLTSGVFRFAWEAHGKRYAIGREIDLWRDAGLAVVVSGSRAHLTAAINEIGEVWPVLITASPEVIAERLAARGREPSSAIQSRLRRGREETVQHENLVTIDNSGSREEAGQIFVSWLKGLRNQNAPD